MTDLPITKWRKASASASNGSCVELAEVGDRVAVRDSKLGDASPILMFARTEIAAWLNGCKAGEFDDLAHS